MIEKNIFMVWVGDKVPDYAKFSFESFQSVNPSFHCEFVSFSLDSAPQEIRDLKSFKLFIDNEEKTLAQKCMSISILTKYHLIQKHGGIYVDSDMFPIKQFDDLLLQRDLFKMTKVRPEQIHITNDCGFMGCIKDTTDWSKCDLLYPMSLYDYSDQNFISLKAKFMSGILKFGEHYNDTKYCYVDHYDGNQLNKNTGEKK